MFNLPQHLVDKGRIYADWVDPMFLDLVNTARLEGKRLVVVNGCFDILHTGHLSVFRTARECPHPQRQQLLVVNGLVLPNTFVIAALNSDAYVRRLKGDERPYMPLEQRLVMVRALRYVDAAVGFGEDTPETMLAIIKPHVLVKGAEYSNTKPPGAKFCEEVVFAPMESTVHSTQLLSALRDGAYGS